MLMMINQEVLITKYIRGWVRNMTFLKKLFCLDNSIITDVTSASVLLVDHSKTKLYIITNQSSYKILSRISILVHK